jgi:ABC-2 type transport system ATP-binding protein
MTTASEHAIDVERLTKRYGDLLAVDDISFHVRTGELFAFLGPNGAGKTTTAEIIETIRTPTSGTVRLLGMDVTTRKRDIVPRIGVLPQGFSSFDKITVRETIQYYSRLFSCKHTDVDGLIELANLKDKSTEQFKNLSGGLKQRLGIAIALVNDPEVVFLDEPTTGLDPAARRSLWTVIERLRSDGRSVLLTTHYLEEAEVLCDHVAVMDHGLILDSGTVDELIGRRFRDRAIRFDTIAALSKTRLGALPAVSRVAREDGATLLYSSDVAETIGALLKAADEVGGEPGNLIVRKATLEDVFLDLTGRALRD